nr:RNA-directed DNA polymerase, eukaryota [Tanacetum cinerariifolium]
MIPSVVMKDVKRDIKLLQALSSHKMWFRSVTHMVCSVYGMVVDVFIPSRKSKADSYVSAVNRVSPLVHTGPLISISPVLVLDDECINKRDFSNCAMERVKDFNAILNLQIILADEGFKDSKLFYLGGSGDERVVWVDIEGIPLHAWSRETFTRIGKRWGETLNIEDTFDSSFGRKHLCIITKHPTSILESFKIIVKGRVFMVRAKELFTWNPTFLSNKEKEYMSDDDSVRRENFKEMPPHLSEERDGEFNTSDVEGVAETIFGDNSDSHVKHNEEMDEQHSDDPFEIYELLKQKKVDVKTQDPSPSLSHPLYSHRCDPRVLISEIMFLGRRSQIWTRSFRGILCIWEETVFKKDHVTISDSFVAIYGTWVPNKAKIIIVAIYALQDPKYRRVLWDYISILLSRWNGEKSKVRWAIEGDENSKYFHDIINKKRSQLAIRGVFHKRNWLTDPSLVKKAFLDHYELSYEQAADLERGVSRDEIRSAVWDCGENKSPGPDGFTFEFFRKYWECIGPDFCAAVEHFFENGLFSKGCNSSFVALIPKVTDAEFVNDYRPISLIGSVYKVVTKIMANRLALVVADIVSDSQSAFVAKRQILDGPFILNEASILVNGSPSNEFQFHCGLKQGDPLSPYLFILIMESLHLSVSRAVNEGLFKGIRLQGSLFLSHLFYADDALFIGEWSDANLRGIIHIIKCFFLASGLQININKSQVLGVGVPRATVEAMAVSIGCSIMQQKFRYLGVSVGECMSRHKAWDDVVLTLRSRLSKWKAKTLSIGGRLTLLKLVLGAFPLYTMSIFKVPKGVLKVMESIRNNFFKGAESSERKISWVAWDKILASRKKGGLGVSSYHALNRDKPFCDAFPRIFALELNFQFSVVEKLAAPLDISLRRSVRGGVEQQQFTDLSLIIDSVSLTTSFDRWVCSVSSDGDFSVKE